MQRSEKRAIQAELFASSRNPKKGMILAQRTGGHNEPEKTARQNVKEEANGFVGHGKKFRCSSKSMVLNRKLFCHPQDIWQYLETLLVLTIMWWRRGWCHWHLVGRDQEYC